MKKLIMLLITTVLAFAVVGCGAKKGEMIPLPQNDEKSESDEPEKEYLTGKHSVVIDVEDYGEITVELDADVAPITVTNFIELVNEEFYDGLTFHRIIDGFMIQGGDPLGNGTGGSGQTIKGEFSNNGIENNITHNRGVISMARSGNDMNGASSQFFIVHADSPHLDGDYAGFGHVTSGIEVVDAIVQAVPAQDDNGTVNEEDQPKITSIRVVN